MGPNRLNKFPMIHSSAFHECKIVVALARFPVTNEVELGNSETPRDKIHLEVACGIVFGKACEQILLPSARDIVGEEDLRDSGVNGAGECRRDSEVNVNVPDDVLVSQEPVDRSEIYSLFPLLEVGNPIPTDKGVTARDGNDSSHKISARVLYIGVINGMEVRTTRGNLFLSINMSTTGWQGGRMLTVSA